ncbi:hypothetical protein Tco_0489515 [Tanacetum coccineum]
MYSRWRCERLVGKGDDGQGEVKGGGVDFRVVNSFAWRDFGAGDGRDGDDDIRLRVWINQKSQENRQKRANTDTRKRKSTKEARDAKPKPGKVKKSKLVKLVISMPSLAHLAKESHVDVEKHTRMMDFALKAHTKLAQAVTSKE